MKAQLQERQQGGETLPTLLIPRPTNTPSGSKQLPSPSASESSTPANFTGPVADALNRVLEHLWPRISRYATEVISTEVQPILQAALPSALAGLRFDPERCHLGQQPLEFRKVVIEQEGQSTAAGDIQNLVFQARVEWDADCSIYLSFAGAGLGIRGLKIKGVLLLELVGLMDRPPFFQGLRTFFNNHPDIDLEFQGAAQGLLNSGVIRRRILDVIASQVANLMVVPNRLGFAVTPDADIFCIKSPPAQGLLRLTVHSAQNLLAMDTTWLGAGSSDPYVKVHCGGYSFRSPTQYKTLSPEFSYTVILPVSEPHHQRIRLDLFDEDQMTRDDFLGKLSLPVDALMSWGPESRKVMKLRSDADENGKNGTVCLSAEWRPLLLDTSGTHTDSPGLVFAGVYAASKLPIMPEGTQYWVAIRCAGLSPGFDEAARTTDRCLEAPDLLDKDTPHSTSAAAMSMKSKLLLLKKYGMSEADMSKVLEVDEQKLRDSLLRRSDTDTAGDLARKSTQAVQWDCGFEFPVERLSDAVLSFELWCQSPNAAAKALGTYRCCVGELAECHNCTSWRTVEVPGTCALLKLKLGLRYLAGDATPRCDEVSHASEIQLTG